MAFHEGEQKWKPSAAAAAAVVLGAGDLGRMTEAYKLSPLKVLIA